MSFIDFVEDDQVVRTCFNRLVIKDSTKASSKGCAASLPAQYSPVVLV